MNGIGKPTKKRLVIYFLISTGSLALLFSALYSNIILGFIGLSFIFWSLLFTYITPVRYVKAELLGASTTSALEGLQGVITKLGYKNRAIYLPPRYLTELKSGTAFISAGEEIQVPSIEDIKSGLFTNNPKGIIIPAPGLGLMQLYQKKLDIDFAGVDLLDLQANLPKLLIEDLELLQDLKIWIEENKVVIKTVGKTFFNICQEMTASMQEEHYLACPFHASFALSLTRASGQPVMIESIGKSKDGRTIEAIYVILKN